MPVAHGRSELPTTSAVAEAGEVNISFVEMNVPKMQQANLRNWWQKYRYAPHFIAAGVTPRGLGLAHVNCQDLDPRPSRSVEKTNSAGNVITFAFKLRL